MNDLIRHAGGDAIGGERLQVRQPSCKPPLCFSLLFFSSLLSEKQINCKYIHSTPLTPHSALLDVHASILLHSAITSTATDRVDEICSLRSTLISQSTVFSCDQSLSQQQQLQQQQHQQQQYQQQQHQHQQVCILDRAAISMHDH